MSQHFPGPGHWGQQQGPWGQQQGRWGQQPLWHTGPAPMPLPVPKAKRGPAPFILGALIVLAAVMLGLVVYSLTSGPGYENDSYVPPPPGNVKPFPDAGADEADSLLVSNPLYAQTLPVPVRCELSNPTMDIRTASDDEVKAYIDDVIACNMRVWDQPVEATQRFELVRPVVNIYHDSVTTPCGGGKASGPNASYCAANQQVYFSRSLAQSHPNLVSVDQPHVVDAIMSHEFGHALQARSVMLFASAYKGQQAGDQRTALEYSRRIELQADCFTGMFVQSVRQSVGYNEADLQRIVTAMRLIGDDELAQRPGDTGVIGNHGHGASREYWYQVGLTTTDIGRCNTFTAPADYVR